MPVLTLVHMSVESGSLATGAAVKRRRQALGLTQEQLAARAGVSKSTLVSIENGKTAKAYRMRDVLRALDEQQDGQRRIRERLIEAGIPEEYADTASRVIAAEQPPAASEPAARDRPA